MGKRSSRSWLLFLLAVVVVVVAGVNGQADKEHQGKGEGVFPPEGGGGDDKEHEGKGEGVFPPEGGRGGGGREDQPYPPTGGGGGREFPPDEHGGGSGGGGGGERPIESRRFILSDHEVKRVVVTDAGGMRVVRGVGGMFSQSPMHIGFITMEPNSMFIPQYLDSSLILFVERGEAMIGSIYKDKFVEKNLTTGDLYRIQAGSPFYLVNLAQGQRLHIIASIDTSQSSDWNSFESFFIGGGTNPKSILAGFGTQTLATALNVSYDAVGELLSSRQEGAIVYLTPDSDQPQKEPSMWKRFLEQGTHERKTQMKRMVHVRDDVVEKPKWSLRNLFISILQSNSDDDLDSYNIFNKDPDFKNDYGTSFEVTGDDYAPLKLSDFGVYLVNLTAGSMMAPHVNPTAIEYGIVLSGTGTIQVVFPNGTLAMDAEVSAGEVFYIPQFYAFCQVASRTSSFIFFGFSTSAKSNMPQFLVGQGSVLQTMLNSEFAAAFGLSRERLSKILNAQNQSTILPAAPASPGGGSAEIPGDEGAGEGGDASSGSGDLSMKKMGSNIRLKQSSFAYNMAMGMD